MKTKLLFTAPDSSSYVLKAKSERSPVYKLRIKVIRLDGPDGDEVIAKWKDDGNDPEFICNADSPFEQIIVGKLICHYLDNYQDMYLEEYTITEL